ncbi:hypothetical protein FIBSPDRAFT_80898 [Athelia psychrophila]|uniref:Uncharacterized protein n=1 Tax=Athelia psychrophila TaxID=1759441 RepID=A0A166E9S7_9AGAM|nr:hypothetical protein FIBSPDRAFT_80898 [Fibularhizoctonia sp. CBS 109695]
MPKSLARGVTCSVVAHVRAGTGLIPVVETNCQPHNGVLGSFQILFCPLLLSNLPLRYQMSLLGPTDSGHCAALYFDHLCGEDGDREKLYPAAETGAAMGKTVQVLEKLKSAAEAKASQGGGRSQLVEFPGLFRGFTCCYSLLKSEGARASVAVLLQHRGSDSEPEVPGPSGRREARGIFLVDSTP